MAEQKLGKYKVLDRLGRGGMAEVYRAYHANLDRYVAIKVLHAFLAEDDEFRVRFEKEARNIAKLNHTNIVQVYDFDYAPDRDSYYMVMELIDGVTLKDRLLDLAEQGEKLPLEETLRIVRESASALAYAHSRGMIHRDVKPANLMIDRDERVVLTDFGIAKMLNSKQLTVSGGMIGTPAYMSPEQGLGEPGDERSDIYSLGVIMYQLLVGDLPYDAETALGVILMHVNDPVPEVRAFDTSIPGDVQTIVNRAMAKDPELRYQTADEMIADIDRFKRGEPAIPDAPSTSTVNKVAFQTVSPSPATPAPTPAFETPSAAETAETDAVSTAEKPAEPAPQPPPAPQPAPQSSGSSGWIIGVLILIIVLGGGYFGGVQMGVIPPLTFNGNTLTATPDETQIAALMTAEATEEPAASSTPTDAPPTATNTAIPSDTPTDTPPTATDTAIPSDTPTDTPPTATPTEALSPTPTPSATNTQPPSPTTNATQTAVFAQTATIEACVFNYDIVEQIPADGEEGDFFPAGQPYTREITLLNTGTCPWGENTALGFVSGEDFNAGPRIFIRESLLVGEEFTLLFEGTTPNRGSLEPLSGTWQFRTRGQIPIGEPLTISVLVFEQGN